MVAFSGHLQNLFFKDHSFPPTNPKAAVIVDTQEDIKWWTDPDSLLSVALQR